MTTDSTGGFRRDGIRAGKARLEVRYSGYASMGFEVGMAAGLAVQLSLTMLPVAAIARPYARGEAVGTSGIPGRRGTARLSAAGDGVRGDSGVDEV